MLDRYLLTRRWKLIIIMVFFQECCHSIRSEWWKRWRVERMMHPLMKSQMLKGIGETLIPRVLWFCLTVMSQLEKMVKCTCQTPLKWHSSKNQEKDSLPRYPLSQRWQKGMSIRLFVLISLFWAIKEGKCFHWVVPENIKTPTTVGIWDFWKGEGFL